MIWEVLAWAHDLLHSCLNYEHFQPQYAHKLFVLKKCILEIIQKYNIIANFGVKLRMDAIYKLQSKQESNSCRCNHKFTSRK